MTAPSPVPAPAAKTALFLTVVHEHDDAHLRTLADALVRHESSPSLHVIRITGDGGPGRATAHPAIHHIYGLRDIGLADHAGAIWLGLSRPTAHLATALVGAAHLLDAGADSVRYVSADTMLLSATDPPARDGLAVLQRFKVLPSADGRTPSAQAMARLSLLDDGFFAADGSVRDELREAVDSFIASPSIEAAVVWRAWDSLGASSKAHAIDDEHLGIAWWNVIERGAALTSPDGPRTVRFPGLDPSRPYLLSTQQGDRPRVLLSEHPSLQALAHAYASALIANGWDSAADETRVDGLLIDAAIRAAVRREIARSGGPLPNLGSSMALRDWLRQPEPGARSPQVTRYAAGVWASQDYARHAFRNPLDDQAEALVAWIRLMADALQIPPDLVPDRIWSPHAASASSPETLLPGVNLVGFLRAGFGIGEATRLFANALARESVPHARISISHDDLHDVVSSGADDEPRYDINLICVNVDWLDAVSRRLGPDFVASRYAIGTWWWESNVLPAPLAQKVALFDELWVGSTFIADALASYTDRPIRVFPLPIPVPAEAPAPDRTALGLPEGYMFMFSFDFNSTVERKNPEAIIEAFVRAFAPGEGPVLVLKTINGHRHLDQLEALRYLTGDREDIVLYDGFLPGDQRDAWARACDCYVSLHRCEGFGLTMAEAMAMGKPVIATRYSANLDFMDADTALLVDYTPWTLEQPSGPYPAGTVWAQPDVGQAADLMRWAWTNQDDAAAVGARAREKISATRTEARLADFVRTRLGEIHQMQADNSLPDREQRAPAVLDALEYEQQRQAAEDGMAKRLVARALKPYAAPTDELLRRILMAVDETATRVRSIERRVDALEYNKRGVEDHLTDLHATLGRLGRDLGEIGRSGGAATQWLDAQLHPDLYLADPSAFLVVGADDRPQLGYDNASEDCAEQDRYAWFEDTFRGPFDRVAANLRPYVEILAEHQPVIDVGCGRGEMLGLLGDAGIAARGVDVDAGMVARARADGHDVTEADATAYLADLPGETVGAIFAAQVIEHLPWAELQGFLVNALRALRPGGILVCETVNPHCIRALKAFWLDPTHQHPIFPEAALVYARMTGFPSARIRFTEDTGDLARDRRDSDSYALIAHK